MNVDLFNTLSKSTNCITWQGRITVNGYGHFYDNGKHEYAHRYSCVNPDHLEAITHSENLRQRQLSHYNTLGYVDKKKLLTLQRNHCQKNHKLKYLKVISTGKLQCVDCLDDKNNIKYKNLSVIKSGKNVSQFCIESEKKFSLSLFKTVVKQILNENGINTYSAKTIQARRYLDKALEMKLFNLEDLALHYGLKPTVTKMKKKFDGEIAK